MILDTFYLLFKSDSKQVSSDVNELAKKIEILKLKGKDRSEQENKDLKESVKQHKELSATLQENQTQYTKIAEGIAGAVTAAISFGSISKGIFGAAADNSALQVQADLIGQSTVNLKAYGQAAKDAGGSSEELGGFLQGLFQRFSAVGLGSKIPEVGEVLGKIRAQLKIAGNDLGQRERIFQQFNVPQGVKSLLSLPDDEYNKSITKNLELAANTEKGARIARDYAESWSEVENALNTVFTALGSNVLPAFKDVNSELITFFKSVANNKEDLKNITIGIEILAGAIALSLTPALVSMGIAAATAAASITAIAAVGLGAYKGTKWLYDWSSTHGFNSGAKTSAVSKGVPGSFKTSNEALDKPENIDIIKQLQLSHVNDLVNNGKTSLDFATKSQLGINNNTNSNKTISVKVGDVHIHTAATDAHGIGDEVSTQLMQHLQSAISNLDDGVNY